MRKIIAIITINLLFITTVFAAPNLVKTPDFKPDNLEDLTKDLLKQKEEMDPFSTSNMKVDLESLGLDNVDENNSVSKNQKDLNSTPTVKNSAVSVQEVKIENSPNQQLDKPKNDETKKVQSTNNINQTTQISKVLENLDKKKEEVKIIPNNQNNQKEESKNNVIVKDLDLPKKITPEKPTENLQQNQIKSTPIENSPKIDPSNAMQINNNGLKLEKEINKTSSQTESKSSAEEKVIQQINSKENEIKDDKPEEKKPSKSEIAAQKKRTANEKKQKARLEKLEKLRQKYLFDYSKPNYFSFGEEEVVIPKKRNIDKFVSYEMPAQPIMETLRTGDNLHIPSILTYKDKVENLFKSISSNNVSYFRSIYNEIGQPNLRNESGDTILTYSILSQKHDIIASILVNGADPNLANSLGYTPLEIAIELSDSKSLKLISDNNVDVNYVDAFKRTYLMHAARVGFLPAVELLIDKGVDVNAIDEDGFSALAIAYRHKKDIVVKYLLKHGAKPWVEKPYDPSSQLLIKELKDRWKN